MTGYPSDDLGQASLFRSDQRQRVQNHLLEMTHFAVPLVLKQILLDGQRAELMWNPLPSSA